MRNWRGVGAKTQSSLWPSLCAGLRAEPADTPAGLSALQLTLLHGRKRLPTEHQQQTSLASHAGQPLRFALRAQHVALDRWLRCWREGRQDHSAIGEYPHRTRWRTRRVSSYGCLVDDPRASHTVPTAQRRSPPKRLTPIGRAIPTSSQFLAGGRDRAQPAAAERLLAAQCAVACVEDVLARAVDDRSRRAPDAAHVRELGGTVPAAAAERLLVQRAVACVEDVLARAVDDRSPLTFGSWAGPCQPPLLNDSS